ncbi:MAG: TonB family protein [Nitrospira sp.]|nr:TonB family protein [Nitrospira sp.]
MAQASASAECWMEERQADISYRFWLAVTGSLFLHVGVLALVTWVRLPHPSERPLASAIEVSLASEPSQPSPPSPPPKPVDPPKTEVKAPAKASAKAMTAPLPPPPMKATPAPTPAPPPVPLAPPAPVNQPARDVMAKMELPPDAPKLGDLSPAERPVKRQLKLPDVPIVSEMTEPPRKVPESKPRPSLAEELNRELDQELRNIRKIDLAQPPPLESPPKPAPQVEAKMPSAKMVDTTLKVAGVASGSNAYLGRVRQRISSFWEAPPIDLMGRTYVVVIRFRLHRDGSVTEVEVERSSGNEYYDLAGKRAVIRAIPLPMFPPEVVESHYDAHFTFTVGDAQG